MSNVNFEYFSGKVAEALNIKSKPFLTDKLSNLSEYDSMGKISISILIEELFGFQIEYEELDRLNTLESLYHYCCNQ
jgi:acyl carrier protein